eukprot:scaffold17053_cov75-Skeletonema_dohrnii-CCMP3373.AAC.2
MASEHLLLVLPRDNTGSPQTPTPAQRGLTLNGKKYLVVEHSKCGKAFISSMRKYMFPPGCQQKAGPRRVGLKVERGIATIVNNTRSMSSIFPVLSVGVGSAARRSKSTTWTWEATMGRDGRRSYTYSVGGAADVCGKEESIDSKYS